MAHNQQQQPGSSGPANEYHTGGQQQQLLEQPSAPNSASYSRQRGAPRRLESKQAFEERFRVVRPKWNDLWAGILLIAIFLGFAAVSAFSIRGFTVAISAGNQKGHVSGKEFGLVTSSVVLFALVLAVAFTLSYAYLWGARVFTKQFIWFTGIVQVVFGIGSAVYYFSQRYYSAGIIFALFAVFYVICFISWIPRIPFSVLMLQTTIDVAKKYGHVFMVSFIGGLIGLAFAAWYSVTLVAIIVRYSPSDKNPVCKKGKGGGCSSSMVIGLVLFVTFAAFWISEWLKNTIHTTIAGIYGSWYFCSRRPGGFPTGATIGALRRALTYSFGSVSLGSLIVSSIQLLRHVVGLVQQRASADGNIIGSCFLCITGFLISFIEWFVEFINHYAFSHIALYGRPYFASAKETWTMIKDRGMDALVNDCLIDPVLTMGSIAMGYLCAFLAFLYLKITKPEYNSDGSFTPFVMAFSFLIGLQVCNVFMVPIKSGTATIFVAAAWDPQILVEGFPDLYQKMVAVYPHVQQAIHV
ncbi:hypothetical protein GP486_001922 [Trichoglossum hirsutum]|uniref:Protein PNS1 n=1 Tax=Trichoglossum hirsutum TaxID=265104 RepID=A0A9P8LFZ8_9PEZI|nr:hypothetical protein GP486_001922 [Trichoglossum hirsutum]